MANRKLVVEIAGDPSSLNRAFSSATKSTQRFSIGVGTILKGVVAFGAVTAGIQGVTSAVRAGIDEFSQSSKVAAQTAAVLKSTGEGANVSAKQIDRLGTSISNLSGLDDELVKSGANILLTFRDIRNSVGKGNDIFTQATKATTDLSVALGQDMKSSAILVGKALNDPVRGMTALRRVGVSFTDDQEEQVKALVKTGKAMEAQKLILGELTKEFGGSAKALGSTLPGQINVVKERLHDLAGDMVGAVAPAFADLTKRAAGFAQQLSQAQTTRAKFKVVFQGVESIGRQLFSQIQNVLKNTNWPALIGIVQRGLFAGIRRIGKALNAVNWSAVGKTISQGIAGALKGVARFLQTVDWGIVGRQIVRGIGTFLRNVDWVALMKGVVKVIIGAIKAVRDLVNAAGIELGHQLGEGIRAGLDALGRVIETAALKIALKVVKALDFKVFGHSVIPGIDGLVDTIEGKLDDLAKTAQKTAGTVERAAGSINRSAAVTDGGQHGNKPPAAVVVERTVAPAVTQATRAVTDVSKETAKSVKLVSDAAVKGLKAQSAATAALPHGIGGIDRLSAGRPNKGFVPAAVAATNLTRATAFDATRLGGLGLLRSLGAVGAFGQAVCPGPIENHVHVHLDGQEIESTVTRRQETRGRRNPPQKRGPIPHGA